MSELISAKIICDTKAPNGKRCTTFVLKYPRVLLAEINTHKCLCLSGDTKITFDAPGSVEVGKKARYNRSIEKLYQMWVGECPRKRKIVYNNLGLIEEDRIYRTSELATLTNVKIANYTLACRSGKLPSTSTGSNKQKTYYVKGSDFLDYTKQNSATSYRFAVQKMWLRNLDENTGEFVHATIKDVMYSGRQEVYQITTKGGYVLKCTRNHRLYTNLGYRTLDDLNLRRIGASTSFAFDKNAFMLGTNGARKGDKPLDVGQIKQLRKEGFTYPVIAELLDVSLDRVKHFVRRQGIADGKTGTLITVNGDKRVPWNTGKSYKLSEDSKKSMLEKFPRKKGKDNPSWKGGWRASTNFNQQLYVFIKQHKSEVLSKYGGKCVLSGRTDRIHCHHIIPVYKDKTKAFSVDNLIPLNAEIHRWLHANHLEDKFIEFYNKNQLHLFIDSLDEEVKQSWPKDKPKRMPGKLYVKFDEIVGVTYIGEEDTYDIEVCNTDYHNFVANGIVVHNCKNTASSRAIPFATLIKNIREETYIPCHVGKNCKGMQSMEPLSIAEQAEFETWCQNLFETVSIQCETIQAKLDIHKQWINRYVEPWMYVTQIVSGTEWSNFFALRTHEAAHPDVQILAKQMWDLYSTETPVDGDYHLPFISEQDDLELFNQDILPDYGTMAMISAGRCARVSYLTHEGVRDVQKDIDLANRLKSMGHMSPFEHQAVAAPKASHKSGPFEGFIQYRKTIPNENITEFNGYKKNEGQL